MVGRRLGVAVGFAVHSSVGRASAQQRALATLLAVEAVKHEGARFCRLEVTPDSLPPPRNA